MLTYEYECESCGLRFERRQAITDDPVDECPSCHANVRRLLSGGAGFVLKDSGHGRGAARSDGCSLEAVGRTCCGRTERCGSPPCGGEE